MSSAGTHSGDGALADDNDETFDTGPFFVGPSSIDSISSVETSKDLHQAKPALSPPSSDLVESDSSRRDGSAALDPDGRSHLSSPEHTDHYLALGTLRLIRPPGDDTDSQWRMVGPGKHAAYPNPTISLGEKRDWIKTTLHHHADAPGHAYLRVQALPEDVNRGSRGSLKDFRKVVKFLADFIDTSPGAWDGNHDPQSPVRTYKQPAQSQEESLFYIFNTLSSPHPSLDHAGPCQYSQQSMQDIFQDSIVGLETTLYPYQRRSVAAMLQKEANPSMSVDPRKPQFRDIKGKQFYLDAHEGVLLQTPHLYSEPKGGILAETMGYGKTLICLALILATRGHYPKAPEGRLNVFVQKPNLRTPSLLELAAKSLKHAGIPWKSQFANLQMEGYHFERCVEALSKYEAEFTEPIFHPTTPNRKGKVREDVKVLRLCFGTLLIVPPNLLVQWQHEIEKHTRSDALDVLILDSSTKEIPHYQTLMEYDIVLITKARFEQEYRDDDLNQGRRFKGQEKFRSQLTEVRWLRVICDEGHGFAGSSYRTHAMSMLDKMSIERRWVVSGTPSHSLHGVEVGLSLHENQEDTEASRRDSIRTALEQRKVKDTATEEVKDMERLRVMVVKFLKVQPWANQKGADYADWKSYLAPFDSTGNRRFAPALRVLLQSLIVRHRIEDIDSDLCLPPLHNTTVYLEPSYYDKLSMNLFRLSLTSNAITSERVDEDYMFHPKNRKSLDELINNLRRSSFHWVGFTENEVSETLRVSNAYFNDNVDKISDEDGALLSEAIMNGERALNDAGWRAFSFYHEIGVYIQNFPEHAAQAWALDGQGSNPLLLGTVQAREAQQHVLKHLHFDDPAAGLFGAGLRAMILAKDRAREEQETRNKTLASSSGKSPAVGATEEPKVKSQPGSSGFSSSSAIRSTTASITPAPSLSPRKRPLPTMMTSSTLGIQLPPELTRSKIIGFTSAKLNYLCSRILELQDTEKIIIFYDSNNIAFWIAEALELLSVQFLIYANTLSVTRRAAYLATFNDSPVFRVLLMDLKQASHGLHVAAASRVFIVSPIWQPGIESQAIKRAHRIGQTRPVHVETLVLRGTLEEKILRRRKQMSNAELVKAEKSLLDDGLMNGIIRGEGFLKIADEEAARGKGLDFDVPLFERRDGHGRGGGGDVSADLGDETGLIPGLAFDDNHEGLKRAKRAKLNGAMNVSFAGPDEPRSSSSPTTTSMTTNAKGKQKAVSFITPSPPSTSASPSPDISSVSTPMSTSMPPPSPRPMIQQPSIFGNGISASSSKPKKSVRSAV